MSRIENFEGQYRKWLYIQYRFHPEIEEQERREIAFKNFMNQIAGFCRTYEYNPELFKKAREIKYKIYPYLIFDL